MWLAKLWTDPCLVAIFYLGNIQLLRDGSMASPLLEILPSIFAWELESQFLPWLPPISLAILCHAWLKQVSGYVPILPELCWVRPTISLGAFYSMYITQEIDLPFFFYTKYNIALLFSASNHSDFLPNVQPPNSLLTILRPLPPPSPKAKAQG